MTRWPPRRLLYLGYALLGVAVAILALLVGMHPPMGLLLTWLVGLLIGLSAIAIWKGQED